MNKNVIATVLILVGLAALALFGQTRLSSTPENFVIIQAGTYNQALRMNTATGQTWVLTNVTRSWDPITEPSADKQLPRKK